MPPRYPPSLRSDRVYATFVHRDRRTGRFASAQFPGAAVYLSSAGPVGPGSGSHRLEDGHLGGGSRQRWQKENRPWERSSSARTCRSTEWSRILTAETASAGAAGSACTEAKTSKEWGKAEYTEALNTAALLLGRRSDEWFGARWAARPGEWAERLNSLPKYVVSSTLQDPRWTNVTVLRGGVVDEVTRLKHEVDGDIIVYASY